MRVYARVLARMWAGGPVRVRGQSRVRCEKRCEKHAGDRRAGRVTGIPAMQARGR